MTQVQEFLNILKTRNVNSLEPLRRKFVQLPRIIKDLEKMGYVIEHRPSDHQSTTYRLIREPQPIVKRDPEYVFIGNKAVLKEDIEPEQQIMKLTKNYYQQD